MCLPIDGPNSYRVEVSGWTAKGIFFVEKTMLHWTDAGEKSVELISRLHQGCVVFVRLLHTATGNANFPVAYRALSSAAEGSDGRECVNLTILRPNAEARQHATGGARSASKSPETHKVLSN
jgi:hypothetical protein